MPQMCASILCRVRRALSLAIIFALLGTRAAHALIIGEIEVVSREGEPLLAYVSVSPSSPDEKITAACVSLANVGIVPGQN